MLAKRIVDELAERGRTLSVAESCTGGQLAAALTSVPGASRVFVGGIIAYSYEAKAEVLGVDWRTLEQHGAVSERCAWEMAHCARLKFRSYYALATTGVAGPGGGTAEKPVGLVYSAWATPNAVRVDMRQFGGTRALIQQQTVDWALAELWKDLE